MVSLVSRCTTCANFRVACWVSSLSERASAPVTSTFMMPTVMSLSVMEGLVTL